MKICKVCGNKVKEVDNFCSYCGSKLVFEEIVEENVKHEVIKIKICDLCGEENEFNAVDCKHCGIGFTGKEKIVEKEIQSQVAQQKETSIGQLSSEKKKDKQSTHKVKKTKEATQIHHKKLEPKQLIIISSFFIILGVILSYYGIESSKVDVRQKIENQAQTEINPRINLNAINEINRLEEELKNNPDNPEKLLRLAHLNHDSGFFEKAVSYYEKYLNFKPDDNDAEVDLGVCYYELKQYDKASSIFEAVINKNPKHQIAYLNLGIVNLTQGKIVEAKEYFQKCIALGEHTDAGHRAAELLKSH